MAAAQYIKHIYRYKPPCRFVYECVGCVIIIQQCMYYIFHTSEYSVRVIYILDLCTPLKASPQKPPLPPIGNSNSKLAFKTNLIIFFNVGFKEKNIFETII